MTTTTPKRKTKKAKLTDAERHARFVETGRKVEASEDPKEFDRAFKSVTGRPKSDSSRGRD